MALEDDIRKRTASLLTAGQFLVDVNVSARQGPRKILVVIDADQGVGIDDCALVSKMLSKVIDEEGLIDDNYTLEVSTPGIDQPLKLKRQYYKNVGRKMKIRLQDKTVEGTLAGVTDDSIDVIEEKGTGRNEQSTVHIPFSSIEKAFVLVSFK